MLQGHHTVSRKNMGEKYWFWANRDLGEVRSRLGPSGFLLYFLRERCMGLSKDYNRDLKVPSRALPSPKSPICSKSKNSIHIFFSSHRTTFLLHKKRAESPEPAGKPWNPFFSLQGVTSHPPSCPHPHSPIKNITWSASCCGESRRVEITWQVLSQWWIFYQKLWIFLSKVGIFL